MPVMHCAWLDMLEVQLRELLPLDFPTSVPIYFVTDTELPERCRRAGSVAWTHPAQDLWLETHLRECSRWQGRGFAAVFNEREVDRFDEVIMPAGHLWKAAASAVHESLHYILAPSESPSLMRLESVNELPADVRQMPSAVAPEHEESDRLAQAKLFHGAPFQRLAEHALHRIERAGFSCTHEWLGLWEPDSPPGGFRAVADALREEVHRCQEWPLRLIARTEPPAEYAALFA